MQGKIIKGISGFYYVHVAGSGIYECKAKGVFRKRKIKPLVGDDVIIDVISEEEKTGNVADILERKKELIRPAVSNVDQALLIFAVTKPKPNLNLLDRFLIQMACQEIPVTICFNKKDLAEESEIKELQEVYQSCGCPLLFISAKNRDNVEMLRSYLMDKTTTVAGPSGVGKSTLVNCLQPEAAMETGAISAKIDRGKHTTRHSELIWIEGNTYIMDTPGFSSLDVPGLEKENLGDYYKEFAEYEPYCRFQGCSHITEPDCGVRQALEEGKIHPVRYENYRLLYEELKNRRKY